MSQRRLVHQCGGPHGSQCRHLTGDCFIHFQSDLWQRFIRGDPLDLDADVREPSRSQLARMIEVVEDHARGPLARGLLAGDVECERGVEILKQPLEGSHGRWTAAERGALLYLHRKMGEVFRHYGHPFGGPIYGWPSGERPARQPSFWGFERDQEARAAVEDEGSVVTDAGEQ